MGSDIPIRCAGGRLHGPGASGTCIEGQRRIRPVSESIPRPLIYPLAFIPDPFSFLGIHHDAGHPPMQERILRHLLRVEITQSSFLLR